MYLYEARGFNITTICVDNKFNIKTIKAHMLTLCTHIYGKEYYVVIIEWVIIVIKEREICMFHAITYQY